MATEAITEKKSFLYGFGRVVAAVAFKTLIPVTYHGTEKLRSREAPFILISNHVHALDPVILALPVREQCVFLAKKELAKKKWIRECLLRLHCILVDRHNSDLEAMRSCMKALRMKKVLVIFPEGTRHHEGQMEQIESGTSLIALRGKVPLVPVYLDRPLKLFRRVHAYVGEPIPLEDLAQEGVNVETCEKLNQRIRETYRRMIREAGAR